MSPLILIGVAAAGLLALAGGKGEGIKSTAQKRPSDPSVPTPPKDVMALITGAYNAADPAQLLAVAKKIEGEWPAQAADLRAMAKAIQTAIAKKVTVAPAAAPRPVSSPTQVANVPIAAPEPTPTVTKSAGWSPSIVPTLADTNLATVGELSPEPVSPARLQAGKLALHLSNTRKGSENRTLVRDYQYDNPEAGKADGLYGPKTATSLAALYGIVPPKPFYWPKNPTPVRTEYNAMLMRMALKDPPRFDEWVGAKV